MLALTDFELRQHWQTARASKLRTLMSRPSSSGDISTRHAKDTLFKALRYGFVKTRATIPADIPSHRCLRPSVRVAVAAEVASRVATAHGLGGIITSARNTNVAARCISSFRGTLFANVASGSTAISGTLAVACDRARLIWPICTPCTTGGTYGSPHREAPSCAPMSDREEVTFGAARASRIKEIHGCVQSRGAVGAHYNGLPLWRCPRFSRPALRARNTSRTADRCRCNRYHR